MPRVCIRDKHLFQTELLFPYYNSGPPGVLWISGEWLFLFRELGSTGYYLRGSGEQAHSFGDLGSPAKE